MNTEQGLLRQILLWLWSRHQKERARLQGKLADVHDLVAVTFKSFEERELESLLNENTPTIDFAARGKYLYLEPDRSRSLIPIMTMQCDFQRSIPEVRLRVAMFVWDEENSDIQAIAYRLEAPEGEGVHHYYHAQHIKHLAQIALPCPKWLPDKQPAFPLDARNSLTLMLALLISLYGLDYVQELRTAGFWDNIKTYLDGMRCTEFQPKYWVLTMGKDKKYVKTWKPDKDLKLIAKARNAQNPQEIDRETYSSQKPSKQEVI